MPAIQRTAHITGVRTIGVPASDQDRAFYVDGLGLELWFDGIVRNERWVEVAPHGSPTTIALVRGPDQVRMGVDAQIRLTTDDIESVHAALRDRGLDVGELVRAPMAMSTVRDQDRHRIVIIEEPGRD